MHTLLRCSCATMAASPPAWPMPPKSNHDSKSLTSENTSGSRKLSRLHSSPRLFCSGVPVEGQSNHEPDMPWYLLHTCCLQPATSSLMMA